MSCCLIGSYKDTTNASLKVKSLAALEEGKSNLYYVRDNGRCLGGQSGGWFVFLSLLCHFLNCPMALSLLTGDRHFLSTHTPWGQSVYFLSNTPLSSFSRFKASENQTEGDIYSCRSLLTLYKLKDSH